MATVLLGTAMARMGSRGEGLKTVEQGISFYESVPKGDDDVNVMRELAVSRQKRGDIMLMNGDSRAALASYRQARSTLEPMSKADPQNTMLQLDVAGMDYHEGRALAAAGHYAEAIRKLQSSAGTFRRLRAPIRTADDSPHGLGDIYIWLGDVYARRDSLSSSLQYYRRALAALGTSDTLSMDDDTRCELGSGYVKTGELLTRMGKPQAASDAFRKALQITNLAAAMEHKDVPALYVIAEAEAGLGEVAASLAGRAVAPDKVSLQKEARAAHRLSLEIWRRILNPSRISPSGFFSSASTKRVR
jgi:tetratricopeptide (TPR) repeat protein